ncbi:retron-type reverse transcriptase [Bradyrhizobium sp. USDA 4524]
MNKHSRKSSFPIPTATGLENPRWTPLASPGNGAGGKMDWVLEVRHQRPVRQYQPRAAMKAVRKHVQDEWALLYIERWLIAPMQGKDGAITARDRGTPQGGVISPVLANLFLHYAFDTWLAAGLPAVAIVSIRRRRARSLPNQG